MSLLTDAERAAIEQQAWDEEKQWWAEWRLENAMEDKGEIPTATFLGQHQLKRQIEPFFKAERFPHTIITGVPGTGKTELAKWIAHKRGTGFQAFLAPVAVENIPDYGIVLLDEAHRQKSPEPLFDLMGDNIVTVTIIAATTRPEVLDAAFRSRFFLQLHIGKYDRRDMELIIKHLANEPVEPNALAKFASASAGNPRQAERIMKTANLIGSYDPATVLSTCQINADGLTTGHMDYLKALGRSGRPAGLTQIVGLVGRDETTVREMEHLLVDLGLIEFTTSGRTLTGLGKRYEEKL